MLVINTDPEILREAVTRAVVDGAWAPADVVATVASDSIADRAEILATAWDLVEEGVLAYDAAPGFPGFRPVS